MSASKVNFTPGRVRDFKCSPSKSEAFLWDSKVPGLGLRATRGGSIVYVHQARLGGHTVRVRIGSPDSWDIDKARAEARRLQTLIDQGIDPRAEREAREEAVTVARKEKKRAAVTLLDVWPEYIEANKARWSESHIADHDKAIQAPGAPRLRSQLKKTAGPLHALANVRLADLTPETLQRWLKTESVKRPTAAGRAFRLLRAFLHWCQGEPRYNGLADPSKVLAKKVRREVAKSSAKDDALQREMLGAWFNGIRENGNPVVTAYFEALLLTGARREEMMRLRWADADFQWRKLVIHDKVEGERQVPLTPYLAQRLSMLPRRNEWVFSSATSASGRLTDVHRAHVRALQSAGLPHITLHGLRRSFGTLSEWVECPVGVVAQIQGHKPSAIAEKHYRARPIDLLRMWHTKIEAWILQQAGIEQPTDEQVTLRAVK